MPPFTLGRVIALLVFLVAAIFAILLLAGVSAPSTAVIVFGLIGALALAELVP